MQILIYHGRHGDKYWLADTSERLEAAMRKLFAQFDEWGCYEGDENGIAKARAGDLRVIKCILQRRQDREYEG